MYVPGSPEDLARFFAKVPTTRHATPSGPAACLPSPPLTASTASAASAATTRLPTSPRHLALSPCRRRRRLLPP